MPDQFLQDLWREKCGLPPCALYGQHPNLDELKRGQWDNNFERLIKKDDIFYAKCGYSEEFIQLMKNRLIMGSFRYGLMSEQDYSRFDLMGYIINKVTVFNETLHLEPLVDAGNNCLLAYIHCLRGEPKWTVCESYSCVELYVQEFETKNNPLALVGMCKLLMILFMEGKRLGYMMGIADDTNHAKEIIK